MVEFFIYLVITAALLLLVANLVQGVHIDNWGSAFLAALVLGFVNAIIRPIVFWLSIPITTSRCATSP